MSPLRHQVMLNLNIQCHTDSFLSRNESVDQLHVQFRTEILHNFEFSKADGMASYQCSNNA